MPTLFDTMAAGFARLAELERLDIRNRAAMFTVIEGAVAILRKPKGVYVQANLYAYKGKTWVKAAGGFLRISPTPFGGDYTTSHPDYKVVDFNGFNPRDLA